MNKPLPDLRVPALCQPGTYLAYSLYNYFAQVGYLYLITLEQSTCYISLHRRSHPIAKTSTFRERSIGGLTKTCLSCNHTLSLSGLSPFEAVSQCSVC
jgi:hypothetical protein